MLIACSGHFVVEVIERSLKKRFSRERPELDTSVRHELWEGWDEVVERVQGERGGMRWWR